MTETYACQICEKDFPKTWTDDEAEKEFMENFGRKPTEKERTEVMCDDCYEKVVQVMVESQGMD